MKKITTSSYDQTQKEGFEFAKTLKPGDIICLYGDLGSGKTTFAQGIAKGLGIDRQIISPTFVIIRSYRIMNNELRIKNLYHIDLYRVEKENEVYGLGLQEILNDDESIVVIEWAEKIKKILPQKRVDVYFEYLGEERRKIAFHE